MIFLSHFVLALAATAQAPAASNTSVTGRPSLANSAITSNFGTPVLPSDSAVPGEDNTTTTSGVQSAVHSIITGDRGTSTSTSPSDNTTVPINTTFISVPMPVSNGTITVTGVRHYGVDEFLGIPYAQPPLDGLRFAVPAPATYNRTIDATNPKPACMQSIDAIPSDWGNQAGNYGMSEDCLTLNIVAPSTGAGGGGGRLPVLVFIHGGAFIAGTATLYNSPYLVLQGTATGHPFLLVTVNYRLGLFGWGFGDEMRARGAANLGLRDQLLALRWVRDHIGAFGGDPARVTVMGESAGSMSISMLLLDEELDLFRGAVMQSGLQSRWSFVSDPNWQAKYATVGTMAGCPPEAIAGGKGSSGSAGGGGNATGATSATGNRGTPTNGTDAPNAPSTSGSIDIVSRQTNTITGTSGSDNSTGEMFPSLFDCLKSRPAEAVLNATAVIPLPGPVVDADLIPDVPQTLWLEGRIKYLPFVIGNVMDEGTVFVDPTINSTEQVIALFAPYTEFRDNKSTEEILGAYPPVPALGSPFGTGNETWGLSPHYKQAAAIFGDQHLVADRRVFLRLANRHGWKKAWTYLFNAHSPAIPPQIGVHHGLDLQFSFGAVSTALNFTEADVAIQNEMMTRWINFVYYQDPNGGPRRTANATTGTGSSTMRLQKWRPHTKKDHAMIIWTPGNVTVVQDRQRERAMSVWFPPPSGTGRRPTASATASENGSATLTIQTVIPTGTQASETPGSASSSNASAAR